MILRPAWSSDGGSIAFAVTRATSREFRQELWILPASAACLSAAPRLVCSEVVATEYALSPTRWSALPAWSSDGRLLFNSDRGGSPQVWSVRPDGSDLHAVTPPEVVWPAVGPDGIYFLRLDSDTPVWRVSVDGSQPVRLAWKS